MKMPRFTYHRPEAVEEALTLLEEHGSEAKILAGGQSLLPLMALRLSEPGHLIDISRIPGLDAVREEDGYLAVGTMVRHAAAERSPAIASRAPLAAGAFPLIGHPAIRNRGTVGGSLAHADPSAELPAVALALDAELVARSARGERRIAGSDFFVTALTTALEPTEMLVEVRLPAWRAGMGWSIDEVSRRRGDFALVGLAVVLRTGADGAVERAALSFFGVGDTPVRAGRAEESLVGARPGDAPFREAARLAAEGLRPLEDIHASSRYRRSVAEELAWRGLEQAAARL